MHTHTHQLQWNTPHSVTIFFGVGVPHLPLLRGDEIHWFWRLDPRHFKGWRGADGSGGQIGV